MRSYEPWDNERLDKALQGKTIKRIGNVITYREKLHVKCTTCDHEWLATPQTLERSGCPECFKKSRVGTRKKAKYKISEVRAILENAGYKLLTDEYHNNKQQLPVWDIEKNEATTITLRSLLIQQKWNNAG